jgi:alpha 1,2-mannosyltransferase
MWGAFLRDFRDLPEAPENLFSGRGIVLIGGRFKYLVPVLVAIKSVRETGCMLPIELWFPDNEPLPKRPLQRLIESMGVSLRMLPVPNAFKQVCFEP